MEIILIILSAGSFVAYLIYVLFWRVTAISEGIKRKNHLVAIERSGRSVDWISWLLLVAAVIFGIIYKLL